VGLGVADGAVKDAGVIGPRTGVVMVVLGARLSSGRPGSSMRGQTAIDVGTSSRPMPAPGGPENARWKGRRSAGFVVCCCSFIKEQLTHLLIVVVREVVLKRTEVATGSSLPALSVSFTHAALRYRLFRFSILLRSHHNDSTGGLQIVFS
jgi:hypothetical protein